MFPGCFLRKARHLFARLSQRSIGEPAIKGNEFSIVEDWDTFLQFLRHQTGRQINDPWLELLGLQTRVPRALAACNAQSPQKGERLSAVSDSRPTCTRASLGKVTLEELAALFQIVKGHDEQHEHQQQRQLQLQVRVLVPVHLQLQVLVRVLVPVQVQVLR